MKRSALTRKTPLRRSAWKRGKRKPTDDPAHLEFIRSLPCCVPSGCCDGPIEAHHSTTGRGLSQKTSDHESMPLCRWHHRDFHDARGFFDGWDREKRRSWQREQVELYRPKPAKESA